MPPDTTQPIPPEPTSSPHASPQSEDTGASPQTAPLEIPPEPEAPQPELAPEAPSEPPEAPRESGNLEGVKYDNGGNNENNENSKIVAEGVGGGNNENNENSKIVEAPPSAAAPVGFIRDLLARANAKIQDRKNRKLEKIIQLAQTKVVITNDDVQKLLKVSDATATRYLVKLVEQGRLVRVGSPKDAKYQLVR